MPCEKRRPIHRSRFPPEQEVQMNHPMTTGELTSCLGGVHVTPPSMLLANKIDVGLEVISIVASHAAANVPESLFASDTFRSRRPSSAASVAIGFGSPNGTPPRDDAFITPRAIAQPKLICGKRDSWMIPLSLSESAAYVLAASNDSDSAPLTSRNASMARFYSRGGRPTLARCASRRGPMSFFVSHSMVMELFLLL